MSGYVSMDGHWHVSVVTVDDVQRVRVEFDAVIMPDGRTVPVHWDRTGRRCGTVRTAHGFLVADLRSVADVERYVSLAELTRA